MNQKGFTLAELLGVIVPGMINRITNSGNTAEETENQLIFDATD